MLDRQRKMNGIGGEDRLSSLPDSLICQILLNLRTKDSVRTSVLSSTWRNLWRYVPGLDLNRYYFRDSDAFVSFGDRFLGFDSESRLQRFKIKIRCVWSDNSHVTRWINDAVGRKLEHLKVLTLRYSLLIPPTVYTCESLVSLELRNVILPCPEFVTLLSLKAIYLDRVSFAGGSAFGTLISGCPVLERLTLRRDACDNVKVLRVCSNSLLSFTHFGNRTSFDKEDLVVAIDAPRLYYLKLCDHETASFIIHNLGSLVEVDIDIAFNLKDGKSFNPNNLPKTNMIRDFLVGISNVKDMVISPYTLKVIYNYLRHQPLPLFHNLSFMRVTDIGWYWWMPTTDYEWQMLPVFLESCPSLRDLDLESTRYLEKGGFSSLSERRCFLPSLEYVEITGYDRAVDMKVVSYFLENSTTLKKLTLRVDVSGKEEESVILRKLHTIPRLSTSCQVVVLSDPHSHRL